MTKLKYLFEQLDQNPIFLSARNSSEVDRRLLYTYKESGWIEPLGRGAFMKKGAHPSQMAGVNALQMQGNAPFHIGGQFALDELYGVRHYARSGLMVELFTSKIFPCQTGFKGFTKDNSNPFGQLSCLIIWAFKKCRVEVIKYEHQCRNARSWSCSIRRIVQPLRHIKYWN